MNDEYYMSIALKLAGEAAAEGETPVGAVVVRADGFIAGRGRNRREKSRNALCHAEIIAIDEACRTLGGWRLVGCTMYVTLEPCMMCSGAIVNSRIERVVFAAEDKTCGCTLTRLAEKGYASGTEIVSGVMKNESEELLGKFFADLRRKKKMSKINIIEAASDAQLEAAATLADEIWHEWFPPIIGVEQTDYMVEKFQSLPAMKRQVAEEGYTYCLLLKGSERIGYTAFRTDSDGRLFLSKLYIKKEYRGNGYSKDVFAYLKEHCRKEGLKAIWLTVNKHNGNSIAVYEKCGFRRIGEGVTDIGNSFVMDDYYFELDAQKE